MPVNGHPVSRGWIFTCEYWCAIFCTPTHTANVASACIGVK